MHAPSCATQHCWGSADGLGSLIKQISFNKIREVMFPERGENHSHCALACTKRDMGNT